jgi:hypothetical protein
LRQLNGGNRGTAASVGVIRNVPTPTKASRRRSPGNAAASTPCAMRSAHAGKSSRRVVSALMATAFAQDSAEAAKAQWRKVADQLRPKLPKLARFMDETETDPRLH